jgi:nucleotide-binding universal stress UspA family protein
VTERKEQTVKTTRDQLVVGVDGSALGVAALDWAAAEAARRGARVLAVTVNPGSVDADAAAAAVERVALLHPGVDVEHQWRTGLVADALLTAADGAAMLVLGSHGTGGVLSALLGSVAAYCVRHARGPVVLIPAALTPAPAERHPGTALRPGPPL